MDYENARDAYFLRVEKEYERQIARLFTDALNEIRAEMSKIYEKYAVDGILTNAEMTRYNRLASLEKNLKDIMKPTIKESVKIIDKLKPEEYAEGYFRTGWAFDQNTRIELDWGALNKEAVVMALDDTFYQVAIDNWTVTALNRIRAAISNGLALGQSYPEMMKDVKAYINKEAFEIMRILRTELHSAQEAGTLAGYISAKDQGIAGNVVWVATLDGRTRPTHGAMDGKAQDEDGFFRGAVGTCRYPGDMMLPAAERINCRCTTRFDIEGLSPELRRTKEDGIIPYTTYGNWIKGRKFFK